MLIPVFVIEEAGDGASEWTSVLKTADESVSASTALQDDDELFFTTVAGAFYELAIFLLYASPAGGSAPDIKIATGEDATARGVVEGVGFSGALSAIQGEAMCDQADPLTFGTSTINLGVAINGCFVGNGGVFRVRWAQSVSNANATIVRAGSELRYRRIG